jgi:hypothetical protein
LVRSAFIVFAWRGGGNALTCVVGVDTWHRGGTGALPCLAGIVTMMVTAEEHELVLAMTESRNSRERPVFVA